MSKLTLCHASPSSYTCPRICRMVSALLIQGSILILDPTQVQFCSAPKIGKTPALRVCCHGRDIRKCELIAGVHTVKHARKCLA